MKVLMISTDRSLLVKDSGVAKRIIEYGKFVSELHVIILTLTKDKEGVELTGNTFAYPTKSHNRLAYITDAFKIGKKIIQKDKNRSDWIITTQDPFETGLPGWLLSLFLRVPISMQVHTDFISPYFRKQSALNRVRYYMGKFLTKRAKTVRVVSKRVEKSLTEKLGVKHHKVFTLPVYINMEKAKEVPVKTDLHQKYPQFKNIVLMASRFSPEKNIPLAIKAFSIFCRENKDTGLVIVGTGPEKGKIELLVSRLNIKDRVVVEEWTDDLPSYLKTADIFLLTSNYEGYCLAMVEAMIYGCPVITTDVGVAGDLIKNDYNGFVVPVGGKREIAHSLKRLIGDKSLRHNFANSARHALEDHMPQEWKSRELYLAKYKEIWEKTLKN